MPRGGLVSAGNPCASRLTPKHQRTPNGPLSLQGEEGALIHGPADRPSRIHDNVPAPASSAPIIREIEGMAQDDSAALARRAR
ncbi:hypothetical protein Pssp01_46930 [Pseudomonas sp. NBRC 100443]|nr:hypothetical protein Pssp01_46930 [Pseudomonas sp. NBRC 100443]